MNFLELKSLCVWNSISLKLFYLKLLTFGMKKKKLNFQMHKALSSLPSQYTIYLDIIQKFSSLRFTLKFDIESHVCCTSFSFVFILSLLLYEHCNASYQLIFECLWFRCSSKLKNEKYFIWQNVYFFVVIIVICFSTVSIHFISKCKTKTQLPSKQYLSTETHSILARHERKSFETMWMIYYNKIWSFYYYQHKSQILSAFSSPTAKQL